MNENPNENPSTKTILKQLICSLSFDCCDVLRIYDKLTGKVYFIGNAQDIPCHDLYETSRNMWLYAFVSSIKPNIYAYNGKRTFVQDIEIWFAEDEYLYGDD